METLYAWVVVLAFVSFTALMGAILRDMRKMRKVNGVLTEILRSNWIRPSIRLDLGTEES